MTSVLEIEKAIQRLPREDYGELRQWIEDYDLEQELVASSAQVAQLLDSEDGGGEQFSEDEGAASRDSG